MEQRQAPLRRHRHLWWLRVTAPVRRRPRAPALAHLADANHGAHPGPPPEYRGRLKGYGTFALALASAGASILVVPTSLISVVVVRLTSRSSPLKLTVP